MKEPDWITRNITFNEDTMEFEGWDETQSIVISHDSDREVVVEEITEYAESLG